jgi:hypothetical protein
VFALLVLAHVVVRDPAPAVAGEVPAGLGHRFGRRRRLLQRHGAGIGGRRQAAVGEQLQNPPESGAGAVLVDRLDAEVALAWPVPAADHLRQAGLVRRVAVIDGALGAFLDVEDEVDGDPGTARPPGVRRVAGIADEVSVQVGHRRSPSVASGASVQRFRSRPEVP